MRAIVVWLLVLMVVMVPDHAVIGRSVCKVAHRATVPPISYPPKRNERIDSAFNPQLLSYLNAGGEIGALAAQLEAATGHAEQPQFNAQILTVNITGSAAAEVLVSLDLAWGAGYEHLLSLFACDTDRFVLLGSSTSSEFYDIGGAPGAYIESVIDMNGNGRPEIVLREGMVAQKFHQAVTIYEWDGKYLAKIFDTGFNLGFFDFVYTQPSEAHAGQRDLVIGDRFGYGAATAMAVIEITKWRPITVIYTWDGTAFALSCQYFRDTPISLYETLHNAETWRACGKYDRAEVLYRHMIDDPSLERWSSWFSLDPAAFDKNDPDAVGRMEANYLISFAYYRLIQLSLRVNDVARAEALRDQVTKVYPISAQGYLYAAMSNALVVAYQRDHRLDSTCDAAKLAFDVVKREHYDPGIPYYPNPGDANQPVWYIGFYYDNGHFFSSDPDNLFAVPEDIADMVSIPVCLL